jgi:hypothetical protein
VRRAGARQERKKKKGETLRRGAPLIVTRGGGRGRRKRWVGTATETTMKLWADKAACSFKNSQFLHVARLGHYEQFSQLCRHPILNRIRVKNTRTDSTFESGAREEEEVA